EAIAPRRSEKRRAGKPGPSWENRSGRRSSQTQSDQGFPPPAGQPQFRPAAATGERGSTHSTSRCRPPRPVSTTTSREPCSETRSTPNEAAGSIPLAKVNPKGGKKFCIAGQSLAEMPPLAAFQRQQ